MRRFLVVPGLRSNFYGGNFAAEEPHVEFRGVLIQGPMVYLRDPEAFGQLREQLRAEAEVIEGQFNFGRRGPSHEYFEIGLVKLIKAVLGDTVSVSVSRTGTWSGYGHGKETIRVENPDGSILLEVKAVSYCDGPGHACSYSHGPWFEYGSWQGQGTISGDARLREVVKLFLIRQATFTDLKKAAEE